MSCGSSSRPTAELTTSRWPARDAITISESSCVFSHCGTTPSAAATSCDSGGGIAAIARSASCTLGRSLASSCASDHSASSRRSTDRPRPRPRGRGDVERRSAHSLVGARLTHSNCRAEPRHRERSRGCAGTSSSFCSSRRGRCDLCPHGEASFARELVAPQSIESSLRGGGRFRSGSAASGRLPCHDRALRPAAKVIRFPGLPPQPDKQTIAASTGEPMNRYLVSTSRDSPGDRPFLANRARCFGGRLRRNGHGSRGCTAAR